MVAEMILRLKRNAEVLTESLFLKRQKVYTTEDAEKVRRKG